LERKSLKLFKMFGFSEHLFFSPDYIQKEKNMEPIFKSNETELRAFDFEMRTDDAEDKGIVTGVPIVFERETDLGYYTETISRSALEKTDLKDVRFLVNHNTDMTPLARSRRNNKNSTMQMEVKDDGMHIRVNLDTENNTEAKNLYSAIKRGDVSGMSFMFTVRGDEWEGLDTDKPKRTITDIGKIFEVSAVTFPAYEQTSIDARSAETLEKAKVTLENVRAEAEKKEAEKRYKMDREEKERTLTLLDLEKDF